MDQKDKDAIKEERETKALIERDEVADKFAYALYTMRLGEMMSVQGSCNIQRVPGGWNFIYPLPNALTTAFVPWHDEAMPKWLKTANEAGIMDDEVIVAHEGLGGEMAD